MSAAKLSALCGIDPRFCDIERVLAKLAVGEGCTDEELSAAHRFLAIMADGLAALGPHYHLPWCDVNRRLTDVRRYRHERWHPAATAMLELHELHEEKR